jgi:hypothetical protein
MEIPNEAQIREFWEVSWTASFRHTIDAHGIRDARQRVELDRPHIF